jgi:hypothetical protein
MCLVMLGSGSNKDAMSHLNKSRDLVNRGRLAVLRNVTSGSLTEKQVALPQGIVTLIVTRLLQDMMIGQRDVISSYWDYLRQLVSLNMIAFLRLAS